MIWKTASKTLSFDKPVLMGVLNLTPDSFSDGGRFMDTALAVDRAHQLQQDGADIIDLGGESTRPGAMMVSADEELNRVLPVLKKIRQSVTSLISIDTTKAEVAEACLAEGADIINDVSGLADGGEKMARAVQRAHAGVVLMHRRGNPQTMQSLATYCDTVGEVCSELQMRVENALEWGISRDQIAVDPGLGFSKTVDQNWELVKNIERFHALNFPVLIGPSRKSFLGKVSGAQPSERDDATAAVVMYCALKHVQIFRIHDVGRMAEILKVIKALEGDAYVRSFKMGND